jgi:hypothetical protein
MAESNCILAKLEDLLVYLIPQLNKFPRDQKFLLGGGKAPPPAPTIRGAD